MSNPTLWYQTQFKLLLNSIKADVQLTDDTKVYLLSGIREDIELLEQQISDDTDDGYNDDDDENNDEDDAVDDFILSWDDHQTPEEP